MFKKLLSLSLCLCLIGGCAGPAFCAESPKNTSQQVVSSKPEVKNESNTSIENSDKSETKNLEKTIKKSSNKKSAWSVIKNHPLKFLAILSKNFIVHNYTTIRLFRGAEPARSIFALLFVLCSTINDITFICDVSSM